MPSLVDRENQPYVGYRATVGFAGLPEVAHRIAALAGALAERGIAPADAPFFRYLVIGPDMASLTVEAGVPVAEPVDLGEEYFNAVVPGGKYAKATHHGAPDGLVAATAELLAWGKAEGVHWDRTEAVDGEHWAGRLEVYRTDPRVQPDATKWETDLYFRVAD
ncbi:GyrI-like domain-containing protein [Amycolatopsis rhabdoformis]|uniref:GyrI-like domain-containing protein n=1 Tax=Amycolatopsis rhabdoformis TaxID=1448059 RepID=A0ABZ1IF10_9PSEU|nr:GyrI-like domain-containing protein [Amycolatopsis rhabdoformis]WSE33005.1 GyrI-like domain-containing protein [Amycolatopsis rhabdoformis]